MYPTISSVLGYFTGTTPTMSTPTSPPVRYSKRKRTAVSYIEPDLNDETFMDVDQEEQEEGAVDSDEDDGEFGKRQKKRKRVAKPKSQKKQKPFPFQSLPAELRNTIYALALTDPRGGVHLEAKSKAHRRIAKHCAPFSTYERWCSGSHVGPREGKGAWDPNGDYRLSPALVAVSKEIYAEAAPMLYGGQRFVAQDGFALLAFLMGLRPETVARLRRVAVHYWADTRSHSSTNLPAVALLRDAGAGLDRLEIRTPFVGRHLYNSSYYRPNNKGPTPNRVRLARKIYRDCHPLLYAVMRARGLDAALRVVEPAEADWETLVEEDRSDKTSEMTPQECDDAIQRCKDLYVEELRKLMAQRP
ncbi:hypothetical protein PG995_012243 [Apiospora arundinis]